MMEHADTVTYVCGAVLALAAVCGLAWQLVKPWLREQLFEPLKEINKQVTVNGGRSDPPTLKDDLCNLSTKVDSVANDIKVLALAFNGHLIHSAVLEERFREMELKLRESATPR